MAFNVIGPHCCAAKATEANLSSPAVDSAALYVSGDVHLPSEFPAIAPWHRFHSQEAIARFAGVRKSLVDPSKFHAYAAAGQTHFHRR
jgi:hypothetical protein